MNASVAILGGTGFVGRAFVERWPRSRRSELTVLIHRSRPDWLSDAGVSVRPINLTSSDGIVDALAGQAVVLNLLRPSGDGWLRDATVALALCLVRAGVKRYIHSSSIDVYGDVAADRIDEETPAIPRTAYACEHLAAEHATRSFRAESCIVRLGAVFGPGGQNVVAIAKQAQREPVWRLAARRSLMGRRRMHLVSVQKAADVLRHLALSNNVFQNDRVLVTDDDAIENNFAFVQDTLLTTFGRPALDRVPELPGFVLKAALRLRGRGTVNPNQTFATEKLQRLGFASDQSFRQQFQQYAALLADGGQEAA